MLKTILLLCVGNICRSPMAEALFLDRLHADFPDILVSSAGLQALEGTPADLSAQELMMEKGLDISAHRARQISPKILLASDLILTMSARQKEQIASKLPVVCGRVHRLGQWDGYDIPDPYRRPRIAFEQSLLLIEQGIDSWYKKLWNNHVEKN